MSIKWHLQKDGITKSYCGNHEIYRITSPANRDSHTYQIFSYGVSMGIYGTKREAKDNIN